jgi:predicted GIY-YIG superfamily endonuclease
MEYLCILQSKKNMKFYTGWTNDLRRRFQEHNNSKVFQRPPENHSILFTMRSVLVAETLK